MTTLWTKPVRWIPERPWERRGPDGAITLPHCCDRPQNLLEDCYDLTTAVRQPIPHFDSPSQVECPSHSGRIMSLTSGIAAKALSRRLRDLGSTHGTSKLQMSDSGLSTQGSALQIASESSSLCRSHSAFRTPLTRTRQHSPNGRTHTSNASISILLTLKNASPAAPVYGLRRAAAIHQLAHLQSC